MKSRGGTDAFGFANAIGVAVDMLTNGTIEKMRQDFATSDGFHRPSGGGALNRDRRVQRDARSGFPSAPICRKTVVTNDELSKSVDTTDEWIRQRTGITQRHIADEEEMTSDLAVKAAEQALQAAGLRGADIDAIILATATPDHTFPATATKVQHRIGMKGGFALDVQAVCSGFVYAARRRQLSSRPDRSSVRW